MDPQTLPPDSDEISLADIVQFLSESWKAIVGFAAAGLIGAVGVGQVLPSRYEVSGYLQVQKALDRVIEPAAILAEKMRVPTFFGDKTREVCFPGKELSEDAIVKRISVKTPRQSTLINVSFKGSSPEQASDCLMAVLEDVRRDQNVLANPIIRDGQANLRAIKLKLSALELEREQLLISNRERLASLKARLASAEKFVTDFSATALKFDFRDPQFGAYALLLTTFVSKQTEIKELAPEIKQLELLIASGATPLDNQITDLRREIDVAENALKEPMTAPAFYISKLIVPREPTDPNRALIAVIGLLAGGMAGLGLKLFGRIRRSFSLSQKPA